MDLSAKRMEQRHKLLAAAYELVSEVGIEGLRTRDIAKKAELNLALFHYCFGSKDDLLQALYDFIISRFRSETERFLLTDQTPPERLEALVRSRVYVTQHMSRDLRVWRCFQGLAETSPVVRKILSDHFEMQRARIAEVVSAGIDQGYFPYLPIKDPQIIAAMILSLQSGLTFQLSVDENAFDPQEYASGVLALIVGPTVPNGSEALA